MSDLFSPIEIRGEVFRNRVFMSPMCQYSAEGRDGIPTEWHLVHLGGRAIGGAGLVMVEATAVSAEGRISPWDLGIWNDEQTSAFKPLTELISSHGAIPGIQLAHAGRKASHDRPWDGGASLGHDDGGWDIVAPSPMRYDSDSALPLELGTDDIARLVKAFIDASKRSIEAGFRVIELHFAHGYLAGEFLSPLSNSRQDEYGGTFDNRCRFPLDVARGVRKAVPESAPLFVRVSATEYVKGGWDLDETIEFSHRLRDEGVDLIDCSSGGNSPSQDMKVNPGYQVPFSSKIKNETGILTGAVGLITDASQAEDILNRGDADVILLGRELLRNPYWPLAAQEELDQQAAEWPDQYARSV